MACCPEHHDTSNCSAEAVAVWSMETAAADTDVLQGSYRSSDFASYSQNVAVPLPLDDAEYEALPRSEKLKIHWDRICQGGTDGSGSTAVQDNKNNWPQTEMQDLQMVMKMLFWQSPGASTNHRGDVKPEYRKRDLHPTGSVATCRYEPSPAAASFTGLFSEAWDHGLLRASATSATKHAAALKIFRDGVPSANLILLQRPDLPSDGRESGTFSSHPFSNVTTRVGQGWSMWEMIGRAIERRFASASGTAWPAEISCQDIGTFDQSGKRASCVSAPWNVWLEVPQKAHELCDAARASGKPRSNDFREQLNSIPAETALFNVTALVQGRRQVIGTVVTTSAFIASAYADHGLFFWHETREHAGASELAEEAMIVSI